MSPQIRNIDVAADTLATFIVEGLSAGTATFMLTAEHSDYNPASNRGYCNGKHTGISNQ